MAVDEKEGGRGTCLTQAREEGGGLGALISLSFPLPLSPSQSTLPVPHGAFSGRPAFAMRHLPGSGPRMLAVPWDLTDFVPMRGNIYYS